MKKTWLLIFILFLAILVTSCSQNQNSNDGSRRIVAPQSNAIPIQGKWEVVKELGNKKTDTSQATEWIGKQLEFSKDKVIIGDYTLKRAGFKIRTVNTEEYFLFNHKSFEKDMIIPAKLANVVTLTEADKFYCEILEVDNDKLILEINNFILLMKKPIEKITAKNDNEMNGSAKYSTVAIAMDSNIKSGVLLGLRTPINKQSNNHTAQFTYRTLWIAADNGNLRNIIQTNNILFPRKSGFWEIKVSREKDGENYQDKIDKHNITMNVKSQESLKVFAKRMMSSVVLEDNIINYVGNDYISIENKHFQDNQSMNKLRIIPIDSLPNLIPVNLEDLMGIDNSELLNNSLQLSLNNVKAKDGKIIDESSLFENIGLVRNSGHWYFNGRINYLENNKILEKDYRINLIPPMSLIFYDELFVKWTEIKSVVPDAIDAFTSPGKDFAIVISKKNKLLVYKIQNQSLAKKPLKTINLGKSERIIMAEWATGSYVDNWENTLKSIK